MIFSIWISRYVKPFTLPLLSCSQPPLSFDPFSFYPSVIQLSAHSKKNYPPSPFYQIILPLSLSYILMYYTSCLGLNPPPSSSHFYPSVFPTSYIFYYIPTTTTTPDYFWASLSSSRIFDCHISWKVLLLKMTKLFCFLPDKEKQLFFSIYFLPGWFYFIIVFEAVKVYHNQIHWRLTVINNFAGLAFSTFFEISH